MKLWDVMMGGFAGAGKADPIEPGRIYETQYYYQTAQSAQAASPWQDPAAFYRQFEAWRQQQNWQPLPVQPPAQIWRATLGLPLDGPVTLADVDSAFRNMAKKHHPDHGGNPETMKALNAARECARRDLAI